MTDAGGGLGDPLPGWLRSARARKLGFRRRVPGAMRSPPEHWVLFDAIRPVTR